MERGKKSSAPIVDTSASSTYPAAPAKAGIPSRIKSWACSFEQCPQHAFWLQTSTDRFYPDFVCKLRNDRILVVEYKGKDRWSNDASKERCHLGTLRAERSDGHCFFVMPEGPDHDAIGAEIDAATAK